MNKNNLITCLVDNALDFIIRSVDDFDHNLKFSVFHFHSAMQLFLKARLVAEHWALAIANHNEPDQYKFLDGDFVSVSIDEAINKLEKLVSGGPVSEEYKVLRDVMRYRNKMTYFFVEPRTETAWNELKISIASQQLIAWYFLHKAITRQWGNIFQPWNEKIRFANERLWRHRASLQPAYDQVKTKIDKRKAAGSALDFCPSCGFEAQEREMLVDQSCHAVCFVCGLIERIHFDHPKYAAHGCVDGPGISNAEYRHKAWSKVNRPEKSTHASAAGLGSVKAEDTDSCPQCLVKAIPEYSELCRKLCGDAYIDRIHREETHFFGTRIGD